MNKPDRFRMPLRFTFRSDRFQIPEPIVIFEFTRKFTKKFEKAPYQTFCELQNNIVPMGQLMNGIYFSFTTDPEKIIKEFEHLESDQSLKLEMQWPVPGMVRVDVTNKGNRYFHRSHKIIFVTSEITIPFRVSSNC